ncbi:MAG: hypothetical protein KGZ97_00055 [Bacteroidetes bacterium]|nr:hypothetical protein [Bacteroidota bacterium]
MLKKSSIIILLSVFSLSFSTDYISPEDFFGDSYTEALKYIEKNKKVLKTTFLKYDIEADIAISIVFPELIRYSRFRDFAETTALEVAYVVGGKSNADFSIGRFQMKPSFVEMLEEELMCETLLLIEFKEVAEYPENFTQAQIRRERLNRLMKQDWQLQYLCCFIKLAEAKYSDCIEKNPDDKLLILSSAYNAGLNASYEYLFKISETKTYPYGMLFPNRYSYFEVSQYYFDNHRNNIL